MKLLPMKTRIVRTGLVVAMLAACTVSALNMVRMKEKITGLQGRLQTQMDLRQKAETNLGRTQKDLQTTAAALAQTKAALEVTTVAKQRASEEAATQTRRASELRFELEKTRAEKEAALTELAPFRAAELTAGEVIDAKKEFKRLNEALSAIQEENHLLAVRLKQTGPQTAPVRLPAGLTGKVLVYDPKWQFVVLDVGAEAGMLERGELLVSRDGKLVGKVRVSRVEKDRAIGNVVAGWGAEVTEGDVVIAAYPES
jgi:hypothetical protein